MFKTYTYIRYLCILCFSILLLSFSSGCSENKKEVQPELIVEFSTGTSSFEWDAKDVFLRINAPAGYQWTLSISFLNEEEDADEANHWCHPSDYSGSGDKNVWLKLDENLGPETRRAALTVNFGTTSKELQLTQYGQSSGGGGGGGGGIAGPADHPNLKALELPKIVDTAWTLYYSYGEFSLEYAPAKKHSKWVAWKLHRGYIGSSGRTDAWQWDPRIVDFIGTQPKQQDFSGYDRGHICPSADRTQSREMNAQTFMYSNMTPQNANLNRYIWASLETKERAWVGGYDTLYICAGGTILKTEDISHYTSPSGMSVPKYNFKVILRKKASTGAYDAIGFWFKNESYSPRTQVGVTEVKTVRQIETLTGIDFFYNLPQAIKDEVKNQFNPSAWGIN